MARLIVISLTIFLFYSALAEDCDQAIKDFKTCVKGSFKPPQGGQGGQRPNFGDMKQKMDACFTQNGCTAPQPPARGARPAAGQGNNQNRQCFESLKTKSKQFMGDCIKKADPTFNPSSADDDHHGGHGGFGGFGGHHGGFGGQHGGASGEQGHDDKLAQACGNDQAKAEKVKTCLKSSFGHPQGQGQQGNGADKFKEMIQKACQASQSCKSKLSPACQGVMDKRRVAACQCGKQLKDQQATFKSQEPSCASVQFPPKPAGHKMPDIDCNADPCSKVQG